MISRLSSCTHSSSCRYGSMSTPSCAVARPVAPSAVICRSLFVYVRSFTRSFGKSLCCSRRPSTPSLRSWVSCLVTASSLGIPRSVSHRFSRLPPLCRFHRRSSGIRIGPFVLSLAHPIIGRTLDRYFVRTARSIASSVVWCRHALNRTIGRLVGRSPIGVTLGRFVSRAATRSVGRCFGQLWDTGVHRLSAYGVDRRRSVSRAVVRPRPFFSDG